MIALASRTNELAPSAPDDPPRAHDSGLAGQSEPSGLLFGNPSERELGALIGLLEPFGHPSALDPHAGRDTRVASIARSSSGWKNM